STNHAPKMPSRLRPMNSTASAMAAKRSVFSMIGILGSDVLFRSKHGYYLTRGGGITASLFARKFRIIRLPHWDGGEQTCETASTSRRPNEELCRIVRPLGKRNRNERVFA